jgi:hypothetical protein
MLTIHNDNIEPLVNPENTHLSHYVTNFFLKRIVKENHGLPIHQLVLGPETLDPSTNMSNILATISPQQVNFYDNEHCGNHLDSMSHFLSPYEAVSFVCSFIKKTMTMN